MNIISFSYQGKTKADQLGDFFFEPARLLFGGRKIVAAILVRNQTPLFEFYSLPSTPPTWFKKVLAIVALLPSVLIGMAFKLFSDEEELRLAYEEAERTGNLIEGYRPAERPIVIIGSYEGMVERYKNLLLQRLAPGTPIQCIVNRFALQDWQVPQVPCDLFLIKPPAYLYLFDNEGIYNERVRELFLNPLVNRTVVYYNSDLENLRIAHRQMVDYQRAQIPQQQLAPLEWLKT